MSAASNSAAGVVSAGMRLTQLASDHPSGTAVVTVSTLGAQDVMLWHELESRANALARALQRRGVSSDSTVVVALPNCPEHLVATFATWKLGACVLPLSHRLQGRERDTILSHAQPDAFIAEWGLAKEMTRDVIAGSATEDVSPLSDVVPAPGKAIASGGSTGTPKIIVDPRPLARVPGAENLVTLLTGLRPNQVQLVAGPLFHNGPFGACHYGMFEGQSIVLMERFDAERALELIEQHRVQFLYLVPTMMRRMMRVPSIASADLTSIEALYHTAQPCPPPLKRAWIELLGAERIYEAYGATEEVGLCGIRGDEWLDHPGSVGRPIDSEIRILDEHGETCPSGTVGEIYMRRISGPPTFQYVGAPQARSDADDFRSVGDLGWVDDEGYVFIADRRLDLIITGGSNVYPAEVEAALLEHPAIADVAVVGLPDEDWGKRVHAIVQPAQGQAPSSAELDAHCNERLLPYKRPKAYEFLAELPRDDAGKIRRAQLVEERSVA